MKRAALGFREHTGWAAVVALGGDVSAPVVIDRRRFELCDEGQPAGVFHSARELDLREAKALVRQVDRSARKAARRQLQRTIAHLEADGYRVVAAGVSVGSRQLPSKLTEILASHPMVHTAEGQLFREVLAYAAEKSGLGVTRFVQQQLYERAAIEIGVTDETLRSQLVELGAALGPPWQQDQKEAAAAAWLALACSRARRRRPTASASA